MTTTEPVLECENLTLRRLTTTDVSERYVGWLNDPQVNEFLETRWYPQTFESVRDFVANTENRDDVYLFGMFLKDSKNHIGNIKVGPRKPHQPYAEVSLFIGEKTCWGKGFASEAIAAVSHFAFANMDIMKLGASAYSINQGSIKAFQRAGYAIEGERLNHYVLGGRPANLVELGIFNPDYIIKSGKS